MEVLPGHAVLLSPGHTVGQTFVAQHGGLNGIELWIAPSPDAVGTLTLHLREDIDRSDDLAVSKIALGANSPIGFYRFEFPTQLWSHGVYRYAFLSYEGTSSLSIGATSGEKYINGAAYYNHKPLETHQLAFRLTYDWLGMAVELAWATVRGVGLLGIAALLYLLPGYALFKWLEPHNDLPLAAQMSIGAGISLSIYPLLMSWTQTVGWKLGVWHAWLPLVFGLVAIVVYWYRFKRFLIVHALSSHLRQSEVFWSNIVLIIVALLIFTTRLVAVRSLAAPLWGDSYQHAVIAQLLLDHGGLFRSWEPYAPYESFTVHFGFPAAVAVLSWFTGAHVVQSTIWVGQIINGIAALTMYAPAYILTRSRWSSVAAVLFAGLISVMPGYFVNWGRFAQLSGQAIFPAFVAVSLAAIVKHRLLLRAGILSGVLLAGMVMHYYRMPLYLVPLLLAVATRLLISRQWQQLAASVAHWSLGISIGVMLLLPHLSSLLGSRLSGAAGAVMAVSEALLWQSVLEDYTVWREVARLLGEGFLIVIGASLLISILKRRWSTPAVLLGWAALLVVMPAARMLRLPGTNLMQSFAVIIFMYIPASLLLAHAFNVALSRFEKTSMLFWGLLLVSVISAPQHLKIVNPYHHALVTHPDLKAMEWIRNETDTNANFAVEGFRIYAGSSIVGSDAGWWIPLFTRRGNTIPPQYAILNEIPRSPELEEDFIELVAALENYRLSDKRVSHLLCKLGVTHVYLGQRQGLVGAGAYQLFSSDEARELGEVVFARDRVLVISLPHELCSKIR